MSGKHTPGPWHRNIQPASRYPVVWSGRNKHVAVLALGARHGSDLADDELEANISLIAAAPCLLQALRELVSIVEIHSQATGRNFAWAELDCAKDAIAKAEPTP